MQNEEIISRIYSFLDRIGIEKEEAPIEGPVFLPGMSIVSGKLIIDREKLKYPGDLLHEAGHIAVTRAEERPLLNGEVTADNTQKKGDEMAVLIWSYLAAQEAGIPPEIVFHDEGYKGDARWLLDNFNNKTYIGLPLLKWMGMVQEKEDGSLEMSKWLRG